MAVLHVKKFSCIDEATLELANNLTILIGPQASGKSVLSKLVYFFYDVFPRRFPVYEDEDRSFDEFRADLAEDFKKWFPPTAWGQDAFEIRFNAGAYFIKVSRLPKSKSHPVDHVRIDLSPNFEQEFASFRKELQRINKKADADPPSEDLFGSQYDAFVTLRRAALKRTEEALADDYVGWQVFVPAGRSFFTSVGKAFAAIEYGGFLDPITLRFGRLFTSILSRRNRYSRSKISPTVQEGRNRMMKDLFGGNIMFGRDEQFVEADDGRKIPFGSASSGQQELLPLWLTVEYSQETRADTMLYIEEPEAHLFPAAQSLLVEYIAGIIASEPNRKMLITTHSPYVLSQINLLLKAGQIAKSDPSKAPSVAKVVKQNSWLAPGSTIAYAIVAKRLRNLMDDEGQVDAEYLDEVSGDLASSFSELLELQES